MPMGTSPFTIIGICILLVWLFSGDFIKRREQYFHGDWLLPILAVVALIWLGLIWSADPFGLGIKYAQKTHYWLYAFALSSVFSNGNSTDKTDKLIKAFLLGLLCNATVGFMQFTHIVPRLSKWGVTGYTGFNSGYNTLSILLILGMLTASFYFKSSKTRNQKIMYAGLIIFYFLHLILLEGRGGYLTLVLLSPVILFNMFKRNKLIYISLAYLLVISIMVSSPISRDRIAYTNKYLSQYVENYLKPHKDMGWGEKYYEHFDRIYMWRWAVNLLIENPLIGVGTGGYKEAMIAAGAEKPVSHPHNNILYVAVSWGGVGLFIFGWLFWTILKNGWQNRDSRIGFFVMASSLVILVGGSTETHILDSGGAFLLAVTTGFLSAISKSPS
ncbi:O-antigen ligase family protein [Thermodesulfobacteriota bacterium]